MLPFQRMKRWRKILLEAVKQCGRAQISQLANPTGLRELLCASSEEFKLVLDEMGGALLERATALLDSLQQNFAPALHPLEGQHVLDCLYGPVHDTL